MSEPWNKEKKIMKDEIFAFSGKLILLLYREAKNTTSNQHMQFRIKRSMNRKQCPLNEPWIHLKKSLSWERV